MTATMQNTAIQPAAGANCMKPVTWKPPPREWAEAKTQFAVMFKERFVNA